MHIPYLPVAKAEPSEKSSKSWCSTLQSQRYSRRARGTAGLCVESQSRMSMVLTSFWAVLWWEGRDGWEIHNITRWMVELFQIRIKLWPTDAVGGMMHIHFPKCENEWRTRTYIERTCRQQLDVVATLIERFVAAGGFHVLLYVYLKLRSQLLLATALVAQHNDGAGRQVRRCPCQQRMQIDAIHVASLHLVPSVCFATSRNSSSVVC